jgi:membrane protease YdiL (CAAX protease family)
MIPNPFWNASEHRLRALWRLVIFAILVIILGILISRLFDRVQFNGSPLIALITIVFSTWIAGKLLDRRKFSDFGFHFSGHWWVDFAFGLALGAILLSIIFLVELAFGWITVTGFLHSSNSTMPFITGLLETIVLFLCVGIYEELFSRGYLLRNLAEGFNFSFLKSRFALLIALLISSGVFGVLHAANPNASLISTLNLIVAGVFLAFGYILTGELAIPIGLHITWNFFEGNVFGFPVSGTTPLITFINIDQKGPTLLTGGAFGPEAGIIGLLATILGCVLIALWVRYRTGRLGLWNQLAEYNPPIRPEKASQPT